MKPSAFLADLDRFWSRVDRSGPDECWTWTGQTNRFGYGRLDFYAEGRRHRVLTHRLVLQLMGRPLAAHDVVMHACDNPPCCNPAHLSVGTQVDNMRDCIAKGRADMSGLAIRWNRGPASPINDERDTA